MNSSRTSTVATFRTPPWEHDGGAAEDDSAGPRVGSREQQKDGKKQHGVGDGHLAGRCVDGAGWIASIVGWKRKAPSQTATVLPVAFCLRQISSAPLC